MTILQTTQYYAPEISIEYSEEKQRYLAKVWSRTGLHELEGPDRSSIMYDVATLLREEYNMLLRSLELEQEASKSVAISGQSRDEGTEKTPHKADEESRSNSHMHQRSSKLRVLFYGKTISAPTRSLLRKKLIQQRRKHINRVMAGVYINQQNKERLETQNRVRLAKKRIEVKRKRAIAKKPLSWEQRVSPGGPSESWKERQNDLQSRIADKRQHARDLWTHR